MSLLKQPDLALQDDLMRRATKAADGAQSEYAWLGLLENGVLSRERVDLVLNSKKVATLFGICPGAIAPGALQLSLPLSIRRRGVEQRLAIGAQQPLPDTELVTHLIRAHRWLREIRRGRDIRSLAKADGLSEGCLRVHLQLAFLAPAIQQAIFDGSHPQELTLHRLTRPEMPADWNAQYARTGISPKR